MNWLELIGVPILLNYVRIVQVNIADQTLTDNGMCMQKMPQTCADLEKGWVRTPPPLPPSLETKH